jgi:hypothetical protein
MSSVAMAAKPDVVRDPVKEILNADSIQEAGAVLASYGITQEQIDVLAGIGGTQKFIEFMEQAVFFDLKYGTETCKVYFSEETMMALAKNEATRSKFARPENAESGVKHRASNTDAIINGLRMAQSFLIQQGYKTENVSFFDAGTGTGKPVLIATHPDFGFNFKSATGFDYFEGVLEHANRNKEAMKGLRPEDKAKISFQFLDATDFESGMNSVNVVLAYNPFDDKIMKKFERNLRRHGGHVVFVYIKPLYAEMFKKNGWDLVDKKMDRDADNCVMLLTRGFDLQPIHDPKGLSVPDLELTK